MLYTFATSISCLVTAQIILDILFEFMVGSMVGIIKKAPVKALKYCVIGGKGGIRTHVTAKL